MKKFLFPIFLLVAFLIILTFFLRIPLLFSPFDGAYEYLLAFLGRQVFRGRGFYSTPWSMKPAGEPLVYGILYLLAGVENWELAVRLLTSILNSSATLIIFLLGRTIISPEAGIFAAFFWALFSSGGTFLGTAAYAEMFMPFFTLLGIYLFFIFRNNLKKSFLIFFAGLSLGISLLFKQSALFDFLPLLAYLLWEYFFVKRKFTSKKTFFLYFPLVLGFCLPISIFIIYCLAIGKFSSFYDWVFYKSFLYSKLRTNPSFYFNWMFKDAYIVWVLAILGAILSIVKRNKQTIFLIFWIFSVLFTLFLSGKYWSYYFLQIFIPACFLASFGIFELIKFGKKSLKKSIFLAKNIIISALVVFLTISLNLSYFKTIFIRFIPFVRKEINREEYRLLLSDGKRERERFWTAKYLKEILNKNDKVFVWDGTQALYILADIMPVFNEYIWNPQFWYQNDDWIGFIFSPSSESVDSSRFGLINKLLNNPPNYIVLAIDPVKEIFLRLKQFPNFFSYVFANYEMVKSFQDVWVYKLKVAKEKVVVPEKLVIDPNFASNYMELSGSQSEVLVEPLAGEPDQLSAFIPLEAKLILEEVPISFSFFKRDFQDYVGGSFERPSGVPDLHIRIKGADKSIKMISVKKENDLWVYPDNGLNYVIKKMPVDDELDLFFEPSGKAEGEYKVFIIYEDNSFSRL